MPHDERPWVGVSPCLLGVEVRYDGGHKALDSVRSLGDRVRWVPICPEAGAGLGTPREPARIVRIAGAPRFVGVQTEEDRTDQLQAFIRETMRALPWSRLCGWVLKARSPSCGLGTTPWFSGLDASTPFDVADGLWARALRERAPHLPMIDEEGLADADRRARWWTSVCTFR